MKVSSTEVPPRQVSLAIEVEQDRMDRALEDAYRRLSTRVDVPGFRRGKAPRAMVERMLGRDRIVEDAIERLVPEVVSEAIEQEKVSPYTRPRVESIELDPLRVKAMVGLAPLVELGDYAAMSIEPEVVSIEDSQIDSVINRLRESYAQWAPVERAVQLGDRVGVDLYGQVQDGGRVLLDSKDAEYIVDPEGAQPAPGFAEQIVGLSAGDAKAFSLPLGDDYRDRTLAGQQVDFSITLHWVKEKELPAVDDEFAQQVGEYADAAALRGAVEGQMREREETRVRQQVEEQALEKLVEISKVEFPPQIVEHQAQHMLETFQRNVEQQGLQMQQYLRLSGKDEESFEQEVRTEAESRVRRSLALDAFADAEKIEVEPNEIEDEVRRVAAGASDGDTVEQLALSNPEAVARIREATRERKALARLVDVATGNGTAKIPAEAAAASDTGKTRKREKSSAASSAADTD